jgi:hypothetical protein
MPPENDLNSTDGIRHDVVSDGNSGPDAAHSAEIGRAAPPSFGDNSDTQAHAELQARIDDLRGRLEPLMRTIDGDVDIRIVEEVYTAPDDT